MIDIETVVSRCGSTEVSIDSAREGEGYVAVTNGHTKVTVSELSMSCDVVWDIRLEGFI